MVSLKHQEFLIEIDQELTNKAFSYYMQVFLIHHHVAQTYHLLHL